MTETYTNRNTAEGFIRRLHALLPELRSSVTTREDVYRLSAEFIAGVAKEAGRTIRLVHLMDTIYPGVRWHHLRDSFPDEQILDLMFPRTLREHIDGKVYVWNDRISWERSEPYLVDWKSLPGFVAWHNEQVGDVFDNDVFFLFEENKRLSVFHHEGAFYHLYLYAEA